MEQIKLSKDYSVTEIVAQKNICGKTIKGLNISNNYGINITAIRKCIPVIDDDGQSDIKELKAKSDFLKIIKKM